ncbi:Ig-like domain repeat protein [Micromonospora marina]|uniref:Alpha-tubulin suppressor n=1 Tax=Micromonospora marina TaxID=307120 RepID=A0A1C4WJE7_9ACTN|nr:Ig-like domain repeat protein [Micromonospora marina]SCE96273.1 Alpha-tubulin suppressor [Micromonospora marina]
MFVALGTVPTGVSHAAGPSPTAGPAGTGLAWGFNGFGQLGNGTSGPGTDSDVPVPVDLPAGTTITDIAAGSSQNPGPHSMALTSTGAVLAWGNNFWGQLGNGASGPGTDSDVPVPVKLPTGVTITAIAADGANSMALTSTGAVFAWGGNFYGQLGNGASGPGVDSDLPVPVKVPAGVTITAIASGGANSMALTSTGTVLAWGNNYYGQLGNNVFGGISDVPVPVKLPAGVTITAIAAGSGHSLALTSTGAVLAWGRNRSGQLGIGTSGPGTDSSVPVPVILQPRTTVTALSGGYEHSLAVTSTGAALAWGNNASGQLGNGTNGPGTDSDVPVPVNLPAGTTVTAVAGGGAHSLAVTSTGAALAWGNNASGQLGNGTNGPGTDSDVPVPVNLPPRTTVTAIAAGGCPCGPTNGRDVNFHSLAVATASAAPTSTTTVRMSPADPRPGQPVTFTATVTCDAGTPAGTVTFLDGTTALGSASLSGSPTATATFTVESLTPGNHTIRARYHGAGDCSASESSPLAVTIPRPALPVTGASLPAALATGILLVLAGTTLVLTARRLRTHRTSD